MWYVMPYILSAKRVDSEKRDTTSKKADENVQKHLVKQFTVITAVLLTTGKKQRETRASSTSLEKDQLMHELDLEQI